MSLAACADKDPSLFFSKSSRAAAAAREICASCPVLTPCLVDALERGEKHGIWGGMSFKERQRTRSKLPQDLRSYITQRVRQTSDLCPTCLSQPIQNHTTGWCSTCTAEYQHAQRSTSTQCPSDRDAASG
ncbi:MAG: WhiB family transcriptional regulator [Actinomycetota bacterium]